MKTKNIVFDFGGVLFDWNPRYLYRKLFTEEAAMEKFLNEVCHQEWNEKQDAGRSFKEGVEELIQEHPELVDKIRAYDHRWDEMLSGVIYETLEIFEELRSQSALKIFGLTNWSEEKFIHVVHKYDFLSRFDGIVVSGIVKKIKPKPEIYHHLFQTFNLVPAESLFIDDNLKNVKAGESLGMPGIHFQDPSQLKFELQRRGVL